MIHSIQLGSSWLLIGVIILILLLKLIDGYEYHHTRSWSIIGFFLVILGLALMWLGFRRLGWARMMKIRLFSQPEAALIHTGIFKFCRDPMYRGFSTDNVWHEPSIGLLGHSIVCCRNGFASAIFNSAGKRTCSNFARLFDFEFNQSQKLEVDARDSSFP